MSVAAPVSQSQSIELDGSGLLVPTLQSEPFPIRKIQTAPCTQACPAGINVKAYVSLIAEQRFAEAMSAAGHLRSRLRSSVREDLPSSILRRADFHTGVETLRGGHGGETAQPRAAPSAG